MSEEEQLRYEVNHQFGDVEILDNQGNEDAPDSDKVFITLTGPDAEVHAQNLVDHLNEPGKGYSTHQLRTGNWAVQDEYDRLICDVEYYENARKIIDRLES